MKKTNKKGFTIVELVIVIAVIAILAGVLIPTFTSVIDKANLSKATQAGRNAYTIALAEAFDSDGDATGTVYLNSKMEVLSSATGADWTITFSNAAGTTTSAFTSTTYSGYTFAVASGVYSCTKSGS